MTPNIDNAVVDGFGDEWSRFDQSALTSAELERLFENYFNIFPWDRVGPASTGFDLGCGSGRWAKLVAPRVGKLYLFDPSPDALRVAKRNLAGAANCEFEIAGAGNIPLADGSCDFGYSLGVLHHIPDTEAGLRECVSKIKPGAPAWFRFVWKMSDVIRRAISRLPNSLRYGLSQVLAVLIYLPLARTALLVEKLGGKVHNFPLSQYRTNSLYVMRNDALDRFGTKLERRFSKEEMREMMERCGLCNIRFSETSFWTAVGFKK
jgi:ubiquinone/menaquinone biosynthesis C-methylase UbiE